MPRPNETTVPDENSWTFVQRFLADAELVPFAQNLLKFDGQSLAGRKKEILAFLNPAPATEEEAQARWSDYWVTIAPTYGLARISNDYCFPTSLARLAVSNGTDIGTFFRLWGLAFQYPFAEHKQKAWKLKGKTAQPLVIIATCLVLMAEIKRGDGSGAETKITYRDFVRYVMPLDHFDIYTLQQTCFDIASGTPGTPVGNDEDLDALEERFRTRLCRELKRAQILNFQEDGISIDTVEHRKVVEAWLRFQQKAVCIESENDREKLFSENFGPRLVESAGNLGLAMTLAGFQQA